MRGRAVIMLSVLALLGLVSHSSSADPPAKSGPQPAADIPGPFQPYNATGPRQDKLHCPVCERGLSPAALIFLPIPNGPSKPLVTLLLGLEKAIDKNHRVRFGACVVFLSPDLGKAGLPEGDLREALGVKVRQWAKDAGLKEDPKGNQVVLAIDQAAGPKGYGITEGWTTALLYDKLKVVTNLSFEKELTDADVQKILAAVTEMLTAKKK